MRQFQVPQFIEVEDKIFGPLTLKQFLYILGGGAAVFLLYVFLGLVLTVLIGAPIAAFFAALAFYTVNGQPFVKYVENALNHFTRSKLYVWRKIPKQEIAKEKTPAESLDTGLKLPKLTENKLKDLAWSLDIQERAQR